MAKCPTYVRQCQAQIEVSLWECMQGIKVLENITVTSDTSSDKVPTLKQDEKITLRLDPRLMEMARALVTERKAGTVSEYIRGLIIADAVKQGKSLSGIDIPGWLTDVLVELRLIHPHEGPRSSEPSPAEGNESRGHPYDPRSDKGKPRKKT